MPCNSRSGTAINFPCTLDINALLAQQSDCMIIFFDEVECQSRRKKTTYMMHKFKLWLNESEMNYDDDDDDDDMNNPSNTQ